LTQSRCRNALSHAQLAAADGGNEHMRVARIDPALCSLVRYNASDDCGAP